MVRMRSESRSGSNPGPDAVFGKEVAETMCTIRKPIPSFQVSCNQMEMLHAEWIQGDQLVNTCMHEQVLSVWKCLSIQPQGRSVPSLKTFQRHTTYHILGREHFPRAEIVIGSGLLQFVLVPLRGVAKRLPR